MKGLITKLVIGIENILISKWFRVIKPFALILWIGLIFFMSNMSVESSWELSGKITSEVVDSIERSVENPSDNISDNEEKQSFKNNKDFMNNFNVFIRKCAHVFEFFVLFILLYINFSDFLKGQFKTGKMLLFACAVGTLLLASLDEFHQSFIPGRTGNPKDVLIDSIAIIVGILFIKVIKVIYNYTINKGGIENL